MATRPKPDDPRPHGLFGRMADHYDRFNHLCSLGMDAWWRHRSLRGFPVSGRILDLGSGGGQMSECLAEKQAFCVGLDPSYAMLAKGKRLGRVFLPVQAQGESLPFRDNTWDAVISGFVMRNLESLEKTLRECHRTLRPGGGLMVLDFFPPRSRLLRAFFRIYLGRVVPWVYGRVTGLGRDAAWLSRSIEGFMSPAHFRKMLDECGFSNVRMRPLLFHIAWRVVAIKEDVPSGTRHG
ncbi:MAG: class I SAM-dependent methyltransferase [Candidatus Aminicenantes bacterium]|nr:class I SAM-dependent methyltransferase [Candidatus Aminicenantes bacterium]